MQQRATTLEEMKFKTFDELHPMIQLEIGKAAGTSSGIPKFFITI